LLLLRLTLGAELGWCTFAHLVPSQNAGSLLIAVAALAIVCALAIFAGYLTRMASLLAAGLIIAAAFSSVAWVSGDVIASRTSSGFAAVIAIALACMGPGAFSIDALLYGHREIVIPRTSGPESDDQA
jgi:putative oxidoreductase